MTTYLQATSAQRTDYSLMVVLQWMIMPRVVDSWQTNLSLQATCCSGQTMVWWLYYNGWKGQGLLLGHKRSRAPLPKVLTYVGGILHRMEEALKIHSIRERSETYLEGPASSGIDDACETNMLEKWKQHLMPWYKKMNSSSPKGTMPKQRHCLLWDWCKLGAPPSRRRPSHHH